MTKNMTKWGVISERNYVVGAMLVAFSSFSGTSHHTDLFRGELVQFIDELVNLCFEVG